MSTLVAVRPVPQVQQCRPWLMVSVLVLTDICSLSFSGALSIFLKWLAPGNESLGSYLHLAPLILLFIAVFAALGLYSGVSLSSPEEMRRSTLACLAILVCVIVTRAFIRGGHLRFTWTNAAAVAFSIAAVPVARELLRLTVSGKAWWGYPVVVFGDKQSAAKLVETIRQQMDIGLKPVAVFLTEPSDTPYVSGLPVLAEQDLSRFERQLKGRGYALFAGAADPGSHMLDIVADHRELFPHVLIVPQVWEFSCFRVTAKNVGGLFGLEIRDQMFRPGKQLLKRVLDLVLTIGALIALLPVLLAVALAVRIDSPGPVLYGHRRVGRRGVQFRAWKFRSMVMNADTLLARHLEQNPEQAEEWRLHQKLRHDPRITRVGRFLRRTSLDEIPQLWNVLRGEMSLVGPRPIVQDEISRYGKHYGLYTAVQSGLTGLWQVSGRSETSYEQRVNFDTFYVRNWSVWLDFCILFRTVAVICLRTGAY